MKTKWTLVVLLLAGCGGTETPPSKQATPKQAPASAEPKTVARKFVSPTSVRLPAYPHGLDQKEFKDDIELWLRYVGCKVRLELAKFAIKSGNRPADKQLIAITDDYRSLERDTQTIRRIADDRLQRLQRAWAIQKKRVMQQAPDLETLSQMTFAEYSEERFLKDRLEGEKDLLRRIDVEWAYFDWKVEGLWKREHTITCDIVSTYDAKFPQCQPSVQLTTRDRVMLFIFAILIRGMHP